MHAVKRFTELNKSDVGIAGGKGASLGELTQAGIPVPAGFVVLAHAFDDFLQETNLLPVIAAELNQVRYDDIASVERASAAIHALMRGAEFSASLREQVTAYFDELGVEFVAVRSSTTAEDSSTASWAGELESYLNTTRGDLFTNIISCWASLFTPRAVVYRHKKGLRDHNISVGVVVQTMVQSEVSGIAFTVHPVTRDHNHMIIEACWGLGELIVGGYVTPDAYVLDKRDGSMIDVRVSEQDDMMVWAEGGDIRIPVPSQKRTQQKLSPERIAELATICQHIETHYGFPCDIEWAWANGVFSIVQSRPITTL